MEVGAGRLPSKFLQILMVSPLWNGERKTRVLAGFFELVRLLKALTSRHGAQEELMVSNALTQIT
jgi:hypothetical protein